MNDEAVSISKRITMAGMRRYSGDSGIHSDDKAGEEQGLGGALVQGGQLAGYLNEMMIRTLGQGFIVGGEIAVSFVQPVRNGDEVRTRGKLVASTPGAQGTRLEYEIWLENQRGEKVTVGKASGWMPSA